MGWDQKTSASARVLAFRALVWTVPPVLSVTADGKQSFWHQDDSRGANIMMVENYR